MKKNNDLDLYDLGPEVVSKDVLEDVCNIRQPVLFAANPSLLRISDELKNYQTLTVSIGGKENVQLSELLSGKYSYTYSDKNAEFLEESGLDVQMKKADKVLAPPMKMNAIYDMIIGAEGVEMPYKYDINFRNFLYVERGSIRIKITIPASSKYIDKETNYENFEFLSTTPAEKIAKTVNKTLEIIISAANNKILYIPAYWWYSIKFMERNTIISVYKYRTIMNNVAILPYLGMYYLQMLNTKPKMSQAKVELVEPEPTVAENPIVRGAQAQEKEDLSRVSSLEGTPPLTQPLEAVSSTK